MPRYLIADMESAGHHARYVKWVAEAACSIDGAEVIVAGPRSLLEHSELAQLHERIIPLEIAISSSTAALADDYSIFGLLKKQLSFCPLYNQAVSKARAGGPLDLIVVPYIDQTIYKWATLGTKFGNTPWMGISMLPMFHLPMMPDMIVPPPRAADRIRAKLFRKLLRDRNLRALLTIDPKMLEYASAQFSSAECDKLTYLPDPSVLHELLPRQVSRKRLGIPDSALLVLLYGALHPRKGIQQLLDAASSPECPSEVHVLLAGRPNEAVNEILNRPPMDELKKSGRLHVLAEYVDDQLEGHLLSAADVMWIGYSKFYRMSAILVLAARHGLTSIFTREGIIGNLGRELRLGAEIDPDRLETVISALAELAADPLKYSGSVRSSEEYFHIHSLSYFQSVLKELMKGEINRRSLEIA